MMSAEVGAGVSGGEWKDRGGEKEEAQNMDICLH